MFVMMKERSSVRDVGAVLSRIEAAGLRPYVSIASGRRVVATVMEDETLSAELQTLPGVDEIRRIRGEAKLSTREFRPTDSVVRINGDGVDTAIIGHGGCVVIAGPCAVEDRDSLLDCALQVKAAGASLLRGGAFKPRTSPYAFQGLGAKGLELLSEVRAIARLAVVTEVLSTQDLAAVVRHADVLQVGARNMQNFPLLRAVGETGKPVLLKRGMMSTLNELLLAAEYILATGNDAVILCERGIRTFEPSTRYTLDIAAVPVLRRRSHLPVIVDPSHAAGMRDIVLPLSLAAVAAGASGLLVEVHPHPEKAACDGQQTISTAMFRELMEGVRAICTCRRGL